MRLIRRLASDLFAAVAWLVISLTANRQKAMRHIYMFFGDEMDERDRKKILKRSIRHFSRVAGDLLAAFLFGVDESAFVVPKEQLSQLNGLQSPIVFLTAHIGAWEFAPLIAGRHINRFYGVMKPIRFPFANRMIKGLRAKTDIGLIETDTGAREIIKAIGKGARLGIVADHNAKSGVLAMFGSRRAYINSAIFKMAYRHNACLVPAVLFRQGRKYTLSLEDRINALSPQAAAEEFNRLLEKWIRSCPEQYLWTYNRWKYSSDRDILVLSDGKPGHFKQSDALAKFICDHFSEGKITVRKLELSIKGLDRIIMGLVCVLPKLFFPLFDRYLRKKGLFNAGWPDIVIDTASATAPAAVLLKRMGRARRLVHIMSAGVFQRHFDLNIVARHDRKPQRKNTYVIDGAFAYFREEEMQSAAKALGFTPIDVAVFIGGDAHNFRMDKGMIALLLDWIAKRGLQCGITTSRRTPKEVEALIKIAAEKNPDVFKHVVIANEDRRSGVVEGLCYVAKKVISTPESISMISEAIASNKDVGVLWMDMQNLMKHKEFLLRLSEKSVVKAISSFNDLNDFISRQHPAKMINEKTKKNFTERLRIVVQ